jgi:hypothetical protein
LVKKCKENEKGELENVKGFKHVHGILSLQSSKEFSFDLA